MSSDKLVFISHSSADSDAAQLLVTAIKESGFPVRAHDGPVGAAEKEIESCSLFIPLISAHADAEQEGEFRKAWASAAAQIHDLRAGATFIMPVVIDETADYEAKVPDAFLQVPWMRQNPSSISPEFDETVKRMITAQTEDLHFPPIPAGKSLPPFSTGAEDYPVADHTTPSRINWSLVGISLLVVVVAGVFLWPTEEPSAPTVESAQQVRATIEPESSASTNEANKTLRNLVREELEVPTMFQAEIVDKIDSIPALAEQAPNTKTVAEVEPATPKQEVDNPPENTAPVDSPFQLAFAQFQQQLDPDKFLNAVRPTPESKEAWLPPIALGLIRDFANQRRAIRAGAGLSHTKIWGENTPLEIALTDSYLDQGNWALAQHFSNQAETKLPTSEPEKLQLFAAFKLVAKQDPEAIDKLEEIAQQNPSLAAKTNALLVRALIYQGEIDRALALIEDSLGQPNGVKVAEILYSPPYGKLHDHPEFLNVMSKVVSEHEIERARTWVAARSGQ